MTGSEMILFKARKMRALGFVNIPNSWLGCTQGQPSQLFASIIVALPQKCRLLACLLQTGIKFNYMLALTS